MAEPPAVLLIGHGSRQPHGARFIDELAATLRRDEPGRPVGVGFLELAEPTPAQALTALALGGATRVRVIPLMFTAGQHYRIDVPAALDAVRDSHPRLVVTTAAPLLGAAEDEDDLLAALDTRLAESRRAGRTALPSSWPPAPDGLILLAPGSSDPHARARVSELAHSWGGRHGVPAEAAFCDLRGGEVGVAIALLQARGARLIACGSLFLAAGRLLDAGREAAFAAGAAAVAEPLGGTPALVELIRRRCWEAVPAG